MATLGKGYTYGATEEVTAAKLHALVDSGTCTGIVAADITDATITDAKLASVGGNKLTGLANIPSGSGVIPAANLTSVAQKGANSDITSLSGLTTALTTAQGGTGATGTANGANGVVVPTGAVNTANGAVILDGSGKLPALDGSALTGLSSVTQANDTDAGTSFDESNTTFLSVAKTITSGKTVFLTASGYVTPNNANIASASITLIQGSTVVHTVIITMSPETTNKYSWATCAIVTGLSGSVTFSVKCDAPSPGTGTVYGNLCILEF